MYIRSLGKAVSTYAVSGRKGHIVVASCCKDNLWVLVSIYTRTSPSNIATVAGAPIPRSRTVVRSVNKVTVSPTNTVMALVEAV